MDTNKFEKTSGKSPKIKQWIQSPKTKQLFNIGLLLLAIVLSVTAIFLNIFNKPKTLESTMDGYYMLDFEYSSVTVEGVTLKLPEYFDWQNLSYYEYEDYGNINIRISHNYIVVYFDGEIGAGGTFTMDGDNIICDSSLSATLSYFKVQGLKYIDGRISFTMVFGNSTHYRVYSKIVQ